MAQAYVPIGTVLSFIERTCNHGVPLRVALMRAQRRYGVDRGIIREFLRSERTPYYSPRHD